MSRVIDQRVVNIDELKLEHGTKGAKFEWNTARVGIAKGYEDGGTGICGQQVGGVFVDLGEQAA